MGKPGKKTTSSSTNKELELLAKQKRSTLQEYGLGLLYSIWIAMLPCYLYWKVKSLSPMLLFYLPSTIVKFAGWIVPNSDMINFISSPIYPSNALLFLVTIAFASMFLNSAFQHIFLSQLKEVEQYRKEPVTDVFISGSSKKKSTTTSLIFFSSPTRAAAHMKALFWLGSFYTSLFLIGYGVIFTYIPPI
jgi:hypothetical protein